VDKPRVGRLHDAASRMVKVGCAGFNLITAFAHRSLLTGSPRYSPRIEVATRALLTVANCIH
jgi:hypothetical protein